MAEPELTFYEFHELADILPLMEGQEFDELVEDIRKNGLRQKILTFKGKIIDGRNRFRACVNGSAADPEFEEWEGKEEDLPGFIISMNMHRRHLNESQRAMLGAKIIEVYEAEAKKRKGKRTDLAADLSTGKKHRSSEDAAKVVKTSPRSVESAKKVMKRGTPELVGAVESGKIPVSAAEKIADEPPEEQKRLLGLPKQDRVKQLKAKKEDNSDGARAKRREQIEPSLVAQFESLSTSLLQIVEKARAGNWTELSKEAVGKQLQRFVTIIRESTEQAA